MKEWWWISFADPKLPVGQQFLGVCIVEAIDPFDAVKVAREHNCNPGGEAKLGALDGEYTELASKNAYRLIGKEEATKLAEEMG